jgi:hypothetical protein
LRIFVFLVNNLIHDKTRVTELDHLALLGADLEVFREPLWQHAPNSVCIEFKWQSYLVNELLG